MLGLILVSFFPPKVFPKTYPPISEKTQIINIVKKKYLSITKTLKQMINTNKRYIIIKERGSQRNLLERLTRNPFFKREFDEKQWKVKYYNNVKTEYKNVINNNESSIFI